MCTNGSGTSSVKPPLRRCWSRSRTRWHGPLHRLADLDIGVAGEGRMDAALEADLDRAPLPGLLRPPCDLVDRDEVRRPAQVLREPPLREGAEPAAEVADVRVVDVARH